jgi:predicted TIM-barrel fold metal-dependent hydrolase
LVSADSHVLEPLDWTDLMPPKYRDRAPKNWVDEEGRTHWSYNNIEVKGGFDPCVMEGRPGIGDMESRRDDLAAEGISKEILYPQRSFALLSGQRGGDLGNIFEADEDYVLAYVRAYNTYVAYIARRHPGVLYPAALINFWDPEQIDDQLAEVREMGFKAIVFPTAPAGVRYNDPAYDRVWSAIAASGFPLTFHVGEKPDITGWGSIGASLVMAFHPFRKLWSTLAFAGVFERHPDLKVVFTEGQIHWVPGALEDADYIYRNYGSVLEPRLPHPPSEYWFTNCQATFQYDPVGLRLLDRIGPDRVLWATDYPHVESTLGWSRQAAQMVFDAAETEADAKKIVAGNAVKLWGLD